jgi:cyclase
MRNAKKENTFSCCSFLISHFSFLIFEAMLTKRLIICLDVRNRKVTKGVKFAGNVDLGDPVEMAAQYYRDGVDELVFYDIMASAENRPIDIGMVRDVAREVFIPFSVGGGIRNLEDMREVLLAGAEKVSVNSLAVRNPGIIRDGARAFGNQCIVLGMDARRAANPADPKYPSGYEVVIQGGRTPVGRDAVEWAREAEQLGAGEICLNSIDADGTKAGYDLELTRKVSEAVGIPVIASGGAGTPQHLVDVLTAGKADAALVASMVHYGTYTVSAIKAEMAMAGLPVRN